MGRSSRAVERRPRRKGPITSRPVCPPPPSTISLAWTLLYLVIVASFGFVFVQTHRRGAPRKVALSFAVDPAADLRFMPIFSGPRSVPLAAADILIVWAALVGRVVAVRPHRRWVALAHRWTR